jgi:hypothetical protein
MPYTPREIAEQVRLMVAGEGVVFADPFAADGVLAYPFAPPGHPSELRGREAIRAFFAGMGSAREAFAMTSPARRRVDGRLHPAQAAGGGRPGPVRGRLARK